MGARKVATVQPVRRPAADAAACLTDAATGLIDCGNWAVSASWAVPADCRLGHLLRQGSCANDTRRREPHRLHRPRRRRALAICCSRRPTRRGRPTTSTAATACTSADREPIRAAPTRSATTGRSRPAGHAPEDWLFNAEYPMVRWLEANGYDVSYFDGRRHRPPRRARSSSTRSSSRSVTTSTGRRASAPTSRRRAPPACTSRSSAATRSSGRRAGRPASTASRRRSHARLLQGDARRREDRSRSAAWTGTWRDPRSVHRRRRPTRERADRQIFTVNCCSYARSTVAGRTASCASGATRPSRPDPGQTATLPDAARSATSGTRTSTTARVRRDCSGCRRRPSTFPSAPGLRVDVRRRAPPRTASRSTATRAARSCSAPAPFSGLGPRLQPRPRQRRRPTSRMQQATVNLFADMGVQPARSRAASSPPRRPPTRRRRRRRSPSPAAGATLAGGARHRSPARPPTPAAAWSAASRSRRTAERPGTARRAARAGATRGRPAPPGTATIRSRAVDDSGNIETPSAGVSVTVGSVRRCPCSIWNDSFDAGHLRPGRPPVPSSSASSSGRTSPASSPASGSTRVRRTPARTSGICGPSGGDLLGTATFTGETATGWQQVTFASPIADLREHDLRRVVLHAGRPVRVRRQLLRLTAFDNGAAARARRRHRRAQRRLQCTGPRVPDPRLQQRPTTGSTSSSRPSGGNGHDAAVGRLGVSRQPARPAVAATTNVTATFNEPSTPPTVTSSTFSCATPAKRSSRRPSPGMPGRSRRPSTRRRRSRSTRLHGDA